MEERGESGGTVIVLKPCPHLAGVALVCQGRPGSPGAWVLSKDGRVEYRRGFLFSYLKHLERDRRCRKSVGVELSVIVRALESIR